jgi:D-lactate dehydrogenase (cytochrome)
MDLIDLFIGSEGTLGVISEVEVRLVPAPEEILGVVAFFPSEPDAIRFVRACRGESSENGEAALPALPLALEYFDVNSLNLLRHQKAEGGPSTEIPELPTEAHSAVYVEYPTSIDDFEETALLVIELLERHGSSEETAWTATDERETERLKAFRHALPEAVNQLIGQRQAQWPKLTKLGTDMAVPDSALETMLEIYRSELGEAGLEYVVFGHIGNNHLHVNILPRDMNEYQQGKTLYLKFARRAVELGGTVSAEHGIGKLKRDFLLLLYGEEGIEQMRAVKRVFDPQGILNPGNVFIPST